MAEYIDPWGGMKQGVQTLREAAESQGLQRARNIQNESNAIDLGMKQQMAPRLQQAVMEDVTANIDASTMQQIGAIAEASRFVKGNPAMAKEIGDKMGVSPEMLMNIKEIEPNIHTLDVGDGNTIVVARDAKGGMKVMKTTDPQLEQKHQYRMEENQAKYAAQLANSLAGIAARGASSGQKVMNRRFQFAGVNSEGKPIIFDTATGKSTLGGIDAEGNAITPEGQLVDTSQGAAPPPQETTTNDGRIYPKKDAAALTGGGKALGDISEAKANAESLKKQTMTYDAMVPIASSLHAQHDRIKEIIKGLSGAPATVLNQPLRALKQYIKGDAAQAAYDMYLTEISNENARLTSGGALSTAQTNVASSEKWHKIHNPNMPLKEMKNLLSETVHSADMRVQSQYDSTKTVHDRLYAGEKELSIAPPKQTIPGFLAKDDPAPGAADRIFSELPPNTQAAVRNTPEYKNAKPGDTFQVKGKSGIITIIKR